MTRLLKGVLLFAMASMTAISQSNHASSPQQEADSLPWGGWLQDKGQVLRQIKLNEARVREGEATHASRPNLVRNYSNLGVLYMAAGMDLKAEDAFRRAIALLKDGPQDQLVNEMEQMALLETEMGKTRQSKKIEMKALKIRNTLGDPVGIALTESAIAGIYDGERRFSEARSYAQKAYDSLAGHADVGAPKRIEVWQILGFALTGLHDCDRGIGVLKDALKLSEEISGWGDASPGYSEYLLGMGYWHCRDRDHAAVWLLRGTTDMKAAFGLNHTIYVNAMAHYARFLRQSGQLEAASSAEAVVHQAESVVDASTLTGRPERSLNPSR